MFDIGFCLYRRFATARGGGELRLPLLSMTRVAVVTPAETSRRLDSRSLSP